MLNAVSVAAALLLGVAAIANGTFMLVNPEGWYFSVPEVTTTGPFNQHFVRDIGLIFLLLGGAFFLGSARPHLRVPTWGRRRSGSLATRYFTFGKSRSASADHQHWRATFRR